MIDAFCDGYGLKEVQAFKTIAEQKNLEFEEAVDVELDVKDIPNFYNENGQKTIDIAEVKV